MSSPDDTQPTISRTDDGSPTLHSARFDQHYHNPKGALSESRHVFWEHARLPKRLTQADTPISIFEVGLGSGLNLFMLLNEIRALKKAGSKIPSSIQYTAVEAFPIPLNTAFQLGFDEVFEHINTKDVEQIFSDLHPGLHTISFDKELQVHLWAGLFDEFVPPEIILPFTTIWQDAFSPDANPDLWTDDVFRKLKRWSAPEVIMTTYCAAVRARAAMCVSGWHVARAEGALFKREMTVAALDESLLSDYKRVNEKRYAQRWADGEFQ
jgi:tRNA U34 5-methylaminomethyl-2-thiouridine-forming methyltransferase MnmC